MEILLFKTSIQKSDLENLTVLLKEISGIIKWTIDFEDCDHVLRIAGESLVMQAIKEKLNSGGFDCQHMPVDFELKVK